MDLRDLKLKNLGLYGADYGRILAVIDFGNVTYWYHRDRVGPDAAPLKDGQRLIVDLEKLYSFCDFAYQARFYYGWHPRLERSQHIVVKADKVGFIKQTKQIQYIRHHLIPDENVRGGSTVKRDPTGPYIEIPKCNFDVEIAIDAIRLMNDYDTLCLFSGDSDFARLAEYIKKRGKKIIVIASGQIYHQLKKAANLYINAQQIKSYVVSVNETTPPKGRGLDFGSATGGQGGVTLNR
ncbi:MAG: NYN domain-containing protein [Candidatus Harrisonbacteria bacterium]|nr:NYN domain-containing protein [Candidatus Harrisonbacteria bacterium]